MGKWKGETKPMQFHWILQISWQNPNRYLKWKCDGIHHIFINWWPMKLISKNIFWIFNLNVVKCSKCGWMAVVLRAQNIVHLWIYYCSQIELIGEHWKHMELAWFHVVICRHPKSNNFKWWRYAFHISYYYECTMWYVICVKDIHKYNKPFVNDQLCLCVGQREMNNHHYPLYR